MLHALGDFGAPISDLRVGDFATPHDGFMMGAPPRRVDVLTSIDGVAFQDAWPRRVFADVAPDLAAPFLSLNDLLYNKRSSGRPQDLADIDALEHLDAPSG